MKISIITIVSLTNYGSVLQAFALYKYLLDCKHLVEIINYYPQYSSDNWINNFRKNIWDIFMANRKEKFKKFIRANIRLSENSYSNRFELQKFPPKADIYIAGSDQIWNSEITLGDPSYFLDFIQSDTKISYASSFGRTNISLNELSEIKVYLNKFEAISVREESARDLLAGCGFNNVDVVLDPIFLLDKNDYIKLSSPPQYKHYLLIFTYERNDTLDLVVKLVTEKLKIRSILIGPPRKTVKCDVHVKKAGPEDFIGLIEGADYIITSSFHGTAFSILFNKNFITVAPSSRKTRLDNLLSIVGLENRLISEPNNIDIERIMKPINYKAPLDKLNKQIIQSKKFLSETITSLEKIMHEKIN